MLAGREVDPGSCHDDATVYNRSVGRVAGAVSRELRLVVARAVGLDGNHWLDGRYAHRHVSHVRRTEGLTGTWFWPTRLPGVLLVECDHVGVWLEFRVCRADTLDDDLAARGDGSALEATTYPGLKYAQLGYAGGPGAIDRLRERRNDVRRLTTAGRYSVYALLRADLLAQEADGHMCDGQGISGVDALIGIACRIGCFARVSDFKVR